MSEGYIEDSVLGTLARDKWTDLWKGRVSLPLPGGDVPVLVFPDGDAGANGPTERQHDAARAALSLTPETRSRLEAMLHDNYLDAVDDVDTDEEPEPPPIPTPGDVWNHAWIQELVIPAHEHARGRYFWLTFGCDWEEEHGREVLFRGGVPVQIAIRGGTSLPGWRDAQEREVTGGTA